MFGRLRALFGCSAALRDRDATIEQAVQERDSRLRKAVGVAERTKRRLGQAEILLLAGETARQFFERDTDRGEAGTPDAGEAPQEGRPRWTR